jgi:hypothetical protein
MSVRLATGMLALASLLGAAAATPPAPSPSAVDAGVPLRLDLAPPVRGAAGGEDTACEKCHKTGGWKQAAFDHDQTGFPLVGAHAGAGCRECHGADLSQTLNKTCAGCHQDPHRGELGQQCQGCHTEQTWAPLFSADAHRRTNFPLTGRHASLPCTECHTAMTNRSFERNTVQCVKCHQKDFDGTGVGTVNHRQLGFSTDCATCHVGTTWAGARFTAHDHCFQIVGGRHSNIGCLTCHTSLANAAANGTCSTHTFQCSSCHEHTCARMDALHASAKFNGSVGVPGYACQDPKCYACHTIQSTP